MLRSLALLLAALGLVMLALPTRALAQDATPVAPGTFPLQADPAACTVEPATVEELLAYWYDESGTPIAAPDGMDAGMDMPSEVAIPVGERADAATVAEVTNVVHQVFSCFAAGDALRAYALFTENLARMFGPEPGTAREDAEAFLTMTPEPETDGEVSEIVAITDVMVLDDGRVGAFVVDRTGDTVTTVYAIFAQEDGRWLVDDVIEFSPFEEDGEGDDLGTPTP